MENKNLPAFPDPNRATIRDFKNNTGLTKREYFAAMAMQGLLSNPQWMSEHKGEKYLMQRDIVAEVSIKMADELLKQLNPDQNGKENA